MLSGKFIAPNVRVRKEERSQNYLSFQLTKLGEKEPIKPKGSRRKEIIQIRTETNKIERRQQKILEIESWLFFGSFVCFRNNS